jgi:glycosyltransferase involved in cell wall biosynthesis
MPVHQTVDVDRQAAKIGINAHLLSPESGYRRAGIHQYIVQVLRHLPRLNIRSHYTIYTRDRASIEERDDLTLVSSSWPTEKRSVRILWEQLSWPLQAAQEQFDLLHSMAFVTPVLNNIPTIVTVYDLSFVHFPAAFPTLQRLYLHGQTARSVKKAHRVITISEASRQDLHHFFDVPLDRIDVVLPGVEQVYRPLSDDLVKGYREMQGIPDKFILHVGTLQPRKNVSVLLEAFALSKAERVDLVLVGAKGWQYDEIFVTVKNLGLEGRVHFTGYVADEELPFWYNAAEALVFPSIYEGFGMPVVEAMACGTPVIAARTSSIPEAGGEAALYFDPQDAGALARHIDSVLNNRQLANQMRQGGLKRAQKFSWERAGIETAQVYARALAEL